MAYPGPFGLIVSVAGFGQLRVVIRPIPIAAPLPDVARHVVKAVTIRWKFRDGRDTGETVVGLVLHREFSLVSVRHPFSLRDEIRRPRCRSCPLDPPRAANSNSASVGKRLPAHFAYASASGYAICTTGYFSFPLRSLSGPSGCRQFAPFT